MDVRGDINHFAFNSLILGDKIGSWAFETLRPVNSPLNWWQLAPNFTFRIAFSFLEAATIPTLLFLPIYRVNWTCVCLMAELRWPASFRPWRNAFKAIRTFGRAYLPSKWGMWSHEKVLHHSWVNFLPFDRPKRGLFLAHFRVLSYWVSW